MTQISVPSECRLQPGKVEMLPSRWTFFSSHFATIVQMETFWIILSEQHYVTLSVPLSKLPGILISLWLVIPLIGVYGKLFPPIMAFQFPGRSAAFTMLIKLSKILQHRCLHWQEFKSTESCKNHKKNCRLTAQKGGWVTSTFVCPNLLSAKLSKKKSHRP